MIRRKPFPHRTACSEDLGFRVWLAPHTTLADHPPSLFELRRAGTASFHRTPDLSGFPLRRFPRASAQNRVLRSAAKPIQALAAFLRGGSSGRVVGRRKGSA